jgi:hypothetical protein
LRARPVGKFDAEAQDMRLRHLQAKAASIASQAKSGSITALEAMARIFDWWDWPYTESAVFEVHWTGDGYLGDLLRVLSGNSGLREPDAAYYIGFEAFGEARGRRGGRGDTGFKKEFRDGSNQVAHATATMYASSTIGGFADLHRILRPDSPADTRLNDAAVSLQRNMNVTRKKMSVGQMIREQLGDPNEVGPFDGVEIPGNPD